MKIITFFIFIITFLIISLPTLSLSAVPTDFQKQQVIEIAKKYKVNYKLVLAIIHVESSWRPNVISSDGCVGLMQIKPSTAKFVTGYNYTIEHLKNPYLNVAIGCAIINYYYKLYKTRKRILYHYSGGAKNYYSKVMKIMKEL